MRRILVILGLAALALLGVGTAGLAWAHWSIRRLDPPLPSVRALLAMEPESDLPVRLSWLDTASQRMPRAAVLEPGRDPHPTAPYVMSHVAFVLEWSDGRLFLIDLGMDREAALSFGAPLVWLAGADPIEPHAALADRLGESAARVRGLAFTHLHVDHTAGIAALCAGRRTPLPLYQGALQAQRSNYTTRPGRAALARAACTDARPLEGPPPRTVPGFPGLLVIPVAGHTPGSQIFVAHVRTAAGVATWAFTGDVVNHADGIRFDVPKPWLYGLLVVPEAPRRLARLRRFLAELAERHDVGLLVSHDRAQLEASGLPRFGAER